MKNIVIFYIFFLFLGSGWGWADEQSSATSSSCEEGLDISTLPLFTPFIKTDLPDLEDYFTCKAAVKENIQICDIFPDGSSQKTNCQDAYNEYAAFGSLFKNKQMSKEFLDVCLQHGGEKATRASCEQMAEVLLSGNSGDCEKVEGITPEDVAKCKDMTSSNPSQKTAFFMMVLRKGDISLCAQVPTSDLVPAPFAAVAICKGLLSKDVDGCQLNAGVNRFKKLYCQQAQ